jgi:cellulose synthase/poly-beta-1,6-N-acetylglucosamine synthase-like glycosyltransferase
MASSDLVIVLYLGILLCLAVYGFHRSQLVYLYYRHRDGRPRPAGRFAELPSVTVQLPLYNEMYVVERLLDAVVALRYPRDRFQVQVLDDSTDETQEICRRKIAELHTTFPELDIEYIHRRDRTGFKAGALENGLRTAKGSVLLILDADFLPRPDMLERTIHYFVDPRIAVVQCRWEHINRDFSALTEAQALLLDGHFVMEHAGRAWSGRFFNFNGTAGLWRRAAIAPSGGWQHDTLTEDMDLSYRAQLCGWKFVYVPEVAAPAELPVEMSAFKSQQFRWAKGSLQVAKKLLPRILRSNATWAQKSEAFFHLTNNIAYPLLLLLSLLLLGRGGSRQTNILGVAAITPIVLLVFVAFYDRELFEVRYFLVAIPLLFLLIARLVTGWIRKPEARLAAVGIILFTLLLGLLDQQTNDDNPRLYDFKGAIERIQADATPKALVLYEPPDMRYVMEYYAPELRSRPLRRGVPKRREGTPVFVLASFQDNDLFFDRTNRVVGKLDFQRRLLARFETPQTKVWEFR